ncbi:hypothetical protein GE09DRAFT_678766 [Coniochaeta sp. 2T2.1]|nr:hypothetical protein GE09DRAFT_678766 [Coniochaeta sp. 2T2.1]
MKSAVFNDGLLLRLALSAVGTLRNGPLGCVPLLVPGTVLFVVRAAIRAFVSLGRPRPSNVVLGATRHEVTSEAPKPTHTRSAPTSCQPSNKPPRPAIEDAVYTTEKCEPLPQQATHCLLPLRGRICGAKHRRSLAFHNYPLSDLEIHHFSRSGFQRFPTLFLSRVFDLREHSGGLGHISSALQGHWAHLYYISTSLTGNLGATRLPVSPFDNFSLHSIFFRRYMGWERKHLLDTGKIPGVLGGKETAFARA